MMGDHTVYGEIKFTYDLTSPTVTNIEDGNHTCGSVEINLIVNTDEQGNISKYFYQVYNQGKYVGTLPKKKEPEKKKSTLAGLSSYLEDLKNESTFEENETAEIEPEKQVDIGKVGAMVLSGETGPEMPIIIPALDLILGNEYTIKVKAVDAAGNEGEFAESDGIAVVNQSYWICQEQKPPEVFFNFNDSSCTIVTAEMTCQDASGCSILYGKSSSEALCNATADYTGNKLTFDKNGWICYHAEDYQNQSASGTKQVPFSDEDGDKILDHCDKCSGTAAGKIANEEGCADGEVPDDETMEDTDGDGLPDKWEKSYDGLDCSLNYASQDSDDNGVADNSEDYDGDSYNNYQEYLYGNNPCLADAPLEDISTIEPDKSDLKFPDISLTDKEPNILALIFLFLGILMILGGAGYLIYYYFYSPAGKAVVRPASIARRAIPGVVRAKPGMLSDWKEKLLQLKKSRAKKLKLQKRAGVFGKFGPESRKIPHLEKFISKKSPNLSHLQNMAQKYSEHKDEIKPGLKSGEKSIFNKLENIAKQTKDKKIHRVVNKSEANDIFNKLKNISKKRKRK